MDSTKNKKSTTWEKGGASPNPSGRRKGTGRPISRLRSTLNKLKLLEPEAVEIIGKGLVPDLDGEGKEIPVDSKKLDNAWKIINAINTLTRGAIAEEAYKISTQEPLEPLQEQKEATNDAPPKRFSLTMIEEE